MTQTAYRPPPAARCSCAASEMESEAERFIIGADQRVLVTDTRAAPFRYIVNLEYDFGGAIGVRAMCSGTLVGPRTVLTAGHCLSGNVPARMRVIPGRAGPLEPLPATRATAFRMFPAY